MGSIMCSVLHIVLMYPMLSALPGFQCHSAVTVFFCEVREELQLSEMRIQIRPDPHSRSTPLDCAENLIKYKIVTNF